MKIINPYAAPSKPYLARTKIRLGVVPAAITGFIGLLIIGITVIHFFDAAKPEIGRALTSGRLAHAFGCVFGTTSLIACGLMLLFASGEWMRHNVVSALLFTFVGPPTLVCLALFFFYSFGS